MSGPLIQVDELAVLLAGDAPRPVVADVRYWMGQPERGREAFDQGHIPGSHFVDLDRELAAPVVDDPAARPGTHPGGRHPLPTADQVQALAVRLGLEADSSLVVLDQTDGFAASRLWWVLGDAGFTSVRVLDGGMAAWQQAGGELTTEPTPDGQGTVVTRPGQWTVLTSDEVPAHLAAGHRLVDVRSAERHRGEVEPIDPVSGHVPGAVGLPMTSLLVDGRLRPRDELRTLLGGFDEADAFTCGSGITAGHALFAAAVAGVGPTALHAGSWSDWISDPARPIGRGEEPRRSL